jgi:hypothetical protein
VASTVVPERYLETGSSQTPPPSSERQARPIRRLNQTSHLCISTPIGKGQHGNGVYLAILPDRKYQALPAANPMAAMQPASATPNNLRSWQRRRNPSPAA